MFWKKTTSEQEINQLNETIKKSFVNVKRDTTSIFQWLNYFYTKSLQQEQIIRQIQVELSYLPKTQDEIRRIVDYYYPVKDIMAKIRELSNNLDELTRVQMKYELDRKLKNQEPIKADETHQEKDATMKYLSVLQALQASLASFEKRLQNLEHKKFSMKEKIIRKLTRNSKDYIKSVVVSYIKKYERISALQLKDMVVDEQNFCSKSTFYRILSDVEALDEIAVMKEGKEKHYFSKSIKHLSQK